MEYICKFCSKSCKNANSLRNHERLCIKNPDHQTNPMQGVEPRNKKYFDKDELRKIRRQRSKDHKKKKHETSFKPYNCERCGILVTVPYGNNRFCSKSCSCKHEITDSQKKKISNQLISYWNCKERKYKAPKIPKSIFDMSKRTISKILQRSNQSCMICGWKEASCDIHHIKPRKAGGTDDNFNLVIVCPNCHRKIHNNKLCVLPEVNIENLFNNWASYYYVDMNELKRLVTENTNT